MKIAKRYLAVVLSFALFLALPLAFTQEASAASKGTKIWQPVQIAESTTYNNGSQDFEGQVWNYNKKGLNTSVYYYDGTSTVKRYDKKGYLTSDVKLNKKGEPTGHNTYTYSKGKKIVAQNFDFENGVSKLNSVTKFNYKKGNLSTELTAYTDSKWVENTFYRKDGTKEKRISGTPDNTWAYLFDKYGNLTSWTNTWVDEGKSITDSTVYRNTYKKGKLVQTIDAYTDVDGKIWPGKTTVYKYNKDKLVKAVRTEPLTEDGETIGTEVTAITYTYKNGLVTGKNETIVQSYNDGRTSSMTKTTAIKYKKISVDNMCVKAVNERMAKFNDNNLGFSYDAWLL